MHKTQQLLLGLLIYLYSATLFAELNVTVEFEGISGELVENARLFLSIQQQQHHEFLSEGRLRRLHQKAPQEITNALQPFGYYRPNIEGQLQQTAPGEWLARYHVVPGSLLPIKKRTLTFSGEMLDDEAFSTILNTQALAEGKTFIHYEYEALKEQLVKLASERGYFNARFITHRVTIDLDNYGALIDLHYDSGARYHFGEVRLTQDVLDPELLQRYLPFKPGAPYTFLQLIELQQALNDSDYFQSVEVAPGTPQTSSNTVPVDVTLTPRKRQRYSIGLGYGTDTGARAKFAWDIPRFNHHGHRINSEAKLSEIGYSISSQYKVPIGNPRSDQIIYSAGIINETTDSNESTVRTFGASLVHKRGAWRESSAINYQQESYKVAEERDHAYLLIPSIGWSRIWGNNFINILDGLRFDISLRGASDKLFSDNSFLQLQGGIKAITPLGRRNRIISRGRLANTHTPEFQQLPASIRYFAGGSQSVRGYAYQSLGPKDENGTIIGGRNLMTGSIEYEHTLHGKWGVALFYDVGNAIDSFNDTLEHGAGIGLRWQSPVGAIRFDLAKALSQTENRWRLHINIGPDL